MINTEKEKMLAGNLYDPLEPRLIKERKRARRILYKFNFSKPGEQKKRVKLLKKLISEHLGSIHIEPPFYCDYGSNIEIGENFYANFNCVILDVNKVKIGKNCLLAPNVNIYTATHPVDVKTRLEGKEYGLPVQIGDNVWIGGGSIICPGVRIGNNVSIGAGSIVTRDIPDNVVAAGNPCRILRKLSE